MNFPLGLSPESSAGLGLSTDWKNGQQISPIYSYWLSPISLCLYRIRSFIVVGHKLFYVPFKNATIDFIIIIVNTLFLYNIIRMPYFVASDELTLATFMFEPETFLP